MSFIDLHLHSNHSDGSDSPARVVARAAAMGISGMALTDHDTVSGVAEAETAAGKAGLDFLTGVEITAQFDGQEIHIIGLGVCTGCAELLSPLKKNETARNERASLVLEKLAQCGIALPPDLLRQYARGAAVSRMHVARVLCDLGITSSTQEGFDRFLNSGRPAYVPKQLIPAETTIAAIHSAGGLAFVAHPGLSRNVRRLLPRLVELPFDGIEAYHISHSRPATGDFLEFAKSHRLLVSGGSDCHGGIKGAPEMGKVRVPRERLGPILDALAARAKRS